MSLTDMSIASQHSPIPVRISKGVSAASPSTPPRCSRMVHPSPATALYRTRTTESSRGQSPGKCPTPSTSRRFVTDPSPVMSRTCTIRHSLTLYVTAHVGAGGRGAVAGAANSDGGGRRLSMPSASCVMSVTTTFARSPTRIAQTAFSSAGGSVPSPTVNCLGSSEAVANVCAPTVAPTVSQITNGARGVSHPSPSSRTLLTTCALLSTVRASPSYTVATTSTYTPSPLRSSGGLSSGNAFCPYA
mmetsp:Transcript_6557/g.17041  ORF Transcript_6557/g.17041 Transcript_6557/m.17041 type:complete len:245 (-) Transcript_6557:488-1222(-)